MHFLFKWPYLLYPVRAILSRRFYMHVLIDLKGAGLLYLFVLSMLLSVPGTFIVKYALQQLQSLDLSSVVAQIPPSYISEQGVLSANNPQDEAVKLIRNHHGDPVLLYNLQGEEVLEFSGHVPLTITANALIINTTQGPFTVSWESIYEHKAQNFEPLQAARMVENLFAASWFTLWGIIAVWILSILCLVTLIAACFTKAISMLAFKLTINFATAMRLCAFGSTLVGLLLCLQFFLPVTLSYVLMCVIPLFYACSAVSMIKRFFTATLSDLERALDPNEPLYFWCEEKSRITESGDFLYGPFYHELTPDLQRFRLANLARNLRQRMLSVNQQAVVENLNRKLPFVRPWVGNDIFFSNEAAIKYAKRLMQLQAMQRAKMGESPKDAFTGAQDEPRAQEPRTPEDTLHEEVSAKDKEHSSQDSAQGASGADPFVGLGQDNFAESGAGAADDGKQKDTNEGTFVP